MTAPIKYTKNELRTQQTRLTQLLRYLPTLQLKKAMLQSEVNEARHRYHQLQEVQKADFAALKQAAALYSREQEYSVEEMTQVAEVEKEYENIAGVEIPKLISVTFTPLDYRLMETTPWFDAMIESVQKAKRSELAVIIQQEALAALEKELREVSIRVNLFEKILIPRATINIKKIKIFLGDQQLSSVARSKIAKKKILDKGRLKLEELAMQYAYGVAGDERELN